MLSNKTPRGNEQEGDLMFDLDPSILDESNNPQAKEVRYSYITNDIINNKNARASGARHGS